MKKNLPKLVNKRNWKSYSLNQSALFKVGSKKRLAEILETPLERLLLIAKSENNYKIFKFPEETCPFTRGSAENSDKQLVGILLK